jgi:uncharacterized protein YjbI with pentapeptide repeats
MNIISKSGKILFKTSKQSIRGETLAGLNLAEARISGRSASYNILFSVVVILFMLLSEIKFWSINHNLNYILIVAAILFGMFLLMSPISRIMLIFTIMINVVLCFQHILSPVLENLPPTVGMLACIAIVAVPTGFFVPKLVRYSMGGTEIIDVDLRDSNIEMAEMNFCKLQNSDLSGAKLTKINANHTSFTNVVSENSDWSNAEARLCQVVDSCFKGSDLRYANIKSSSWINSDLSNCDFSNADFTEAIFKKVNFCGSSLVNVRFQGAQFIEIIFDDLTVWSKDLEQHVRQGHSSEKST